MKHIYNKKHISEQFIDELVGKNKENKENKENNDNKKNKKNKIISINQINLLKKSFSSYYLPNPAYFDYKMVLIIINQPNSDINPFLLVQDELIRGLFSFGLFNGWFFGGKENGVLILQYYIIDGLYYNINSNFNKIISKIRLKRKNLILNIYEVQSERRFFNEHALFPLDWHYKEYLTLKKPKKNSNLFEIPNEIIYNFEKTLIPGKFENIFLKSVDTFNTIELISSDEKSLLFKEKILYQPNFFNWQFWQIIGYSFSIVVLIDYPKPKKNQLILFMEQLPVGKIFFLKGKIEDNNHQKPESMGRLCVFINICENISSFFEVFIQIMNKFRVRYFISPITPLDLFSEHDIVKIMKISRQNYNFRSNHGKDIYEIPLFHFNKRFSTYTLPEQLLMFTSVNKLYLIIKDKLNSQKWKDCIRLFAALYEEDSLTEIEIESGLKAIFDIV